MRNKGLILPHNATPQSSGQPSQAIKQLVTASDSQELGEWDVVGISAPRLPGCLLGCLLSTKLALLLQSP